jgi:hypothetical protein
MQRIAAAASVCEEGGNGQKNEKALEHHCSRALRLVRLAGIEPTTPWFVAKYSIQLSYSRAAYDYSVGNGRA